MSNETKNEISGILLAGGKARRMGGVNKGAQLLGGRTLAGLVIERMKPQVKSIFISSNEFAAEFDSYGYPVFKDVRQDYPGPLARNRNYLKTRLRRSLVFRLTDGYPVSTEKSSRTFA